MRHQRAAGVSTQQYDEKETKRLMAHGRLLQFRGTFEEAGEYQIFSAV
jgi:hypothetical protein